MESLHFTAVPGQNLYIKADPDYDYTGIHISGETHSEIENIWQDVKDTIIGGDIEPLLTIKSPCGTEKVFKTKEEIEALPIKDIPCSCGRPNHYYLKFQIRGEGKI